MASNEINEISSVTMIGALPPLKGNAYYCMRLSTEISESIHVNFISFKRLYPDFLYPGGVIDSDKKFRVGERKTLKISRTISYLNPFSWIRAAFLTSTSVVHLQWWSLPLVPVYLVILLLLKLRQKKIIFTVHNVVPHEKSPLDQWLTSMVLAFGNKFIVHTEDNRDQLAKAFQIPKDRISVIHMPVHDMYPAAKLSDEEIRDKYKLPRSGPVLLFFGNIRPYKGLDTLIKAMPEIVEAHPRAHLLVAGQSWGNWDKSYGEIIRSLGLADSVTAILDYVPMSEVANLFEASDLVVLPYTHFDAQSGVGNIALAMKKPLVVTRVGGLEELVRDERALCPPGDAPALAQTITGVLTDADLRSKLAADSSYLAARYSWSSAATKTIYVYEH
jgi:glycosyltransferase involved in cell wall biosynthesis